MHILLVEDHLHTAQSIQHVLRHYYSITHATCKSQAQNLLQSTSFDACIVDLNLPDGNGFELLKNRDSTLPTLVLSGQADTQTKVSTLKSGASDFLSKPFALSELAARVEVLFRKRTPTPQVFTVKDIVFSPTERRLTTASTIVHLTKSESALLQLLFQQRHQVVGKEKLLTAEWLKTKKANAVEALVKNLRKKLALAGLSKILETVYGEGYRLNV